MLSCHSCYIYGTWRSKDVEMFKITLWREAEVGKLQKVEGRQEGTFYGIVDSPGFLSENYLPISASFGLKRVLWHAIHNIPSR